MCAGATLGPVTASETALLIIITDGTSSYSVVSGLRVNQDKPLIHFYDKLLPVDDSGVTRETFSIQRQLNGMQIQDNWLNRHLDKVPDLFISFIRTLRVPKDGQTYHLPANLGPFPVLCSEKFGPSLPPGMSDEGGVLLPMFQREATLLCFSHDDGNSNEVDDYAVKVLAGSVNTFSGCLRDQKVGEKPQKQQDYIVAPLQGRLDCFYTAKGIVNQFVAMPLGFAYTAESQLRGTEFIGGIQLQIASRCKGHGHFSLEGHQRDCGPFVKPELWAPDCLDRYKTPRELGLKPERRIFAEGNEVKNLGAARYIMFNSIEHNHSPDYYDPLTNYDLEGGLITFSPPYSSAGAVDTANNYKFPVAEEVITGRWKMGLAVGGSVYQEICADQDTRKWNWADSLIVGVQMLNSVIFETVVGKEAPPCPISVQDYIEGRLPLLPHSAIYVDQRGHDPEGTTNSWPDRCANGDIS